MRRVISLYLPTWPSDRLQRGMGSAAPPGETPLVLIGRDANPRIVSAADGAAQALGIRPGLPATQAHALVPGLVTFDAEPEADAEALERLAHWAVRLFAPVVAADPPDGLFIDATGTTHLHGGEEVMLRSMITRLDAAGITARAALAGTLGAAHALARYRANPTMIVDATCTADAIADLPVSALRLAPNLVVGLRRMGFDRIGELAAAPRAPLARRFGPEPWRRLDQAYGRLAEPVRLARPPELLLVERNFVEPISAPETLHRSIGLLVAELCDTLEASSRGASRLDLLFHRVDQDIEAIRAGTAKPIRDVRRMTRLLCDRLETIDPGFGIERMTLSAPVVEPLAYRPFSTLGEAPRADVSDLIDTLANRVGAEHLFRLAPVESDIPERSVGKIAPMAGPTKTRWPLHWPRPTRLLARPEPIETLALLPDYPPIHFTWRGMRRRVTRADGPERIYGEWIKRDAELVVLRDYFMVEDEDGCRYWLFRAGDGADPQTGSQAWYIHGLFG